MKKTKQFDIPKQEFVKAYNLVRANAGAAGIDKQSLAGFGEDLQNNLYKLWNRMSSGSYFPPPVKAVPIPKKTGGERILGVPTVGDRICQMVVKMALEPEMERIFLADSYGYRPNKSALEAVGITRQRCWRYDWVLEFDIKGMFDNIPHELLMKAVKKHTNEKWILMYIERWLKAPMQQKDGTIVARTCGTPQGGVISPILSNLFMHYAFDKWMQRNYPATPWCRYADDGLAHCKTEQEAQKLKQALNKRLEKCGLQLHPEKTKIIYCKDGSRKKKYQNTSFDFLGYTFRARVCKNTKRNTLFVNFTPAISKSALKAIRATVRKSDIRNRTDLNLADIARWYNPKLEGWINYYGKYTRSALYPMSRHFNKTLIAWAIRKYRPFHKRKTKAAKFMEKVMKENPRLFAHWRKGMKGAFA